MAIIRGLGLLFLHAFGVQVEEMQIQSFCFEAPASFTRRYLVTSTSIIRTVVQSFSSRLVLVLGLCNPKAHVIHEIALAAQAPSQKDCPKP